MVTRRIAAAIPSNNPIEGITLKGDIVTASLRSNPYPPDSLKLKGYSYYRTDSGEYPIVYQVQ